MVFSVFIHVLFPLNFCLKCRFRNPRNWFKGADTHSVLRFLENKFASLEVPTWFLYKESILEAIRHANECLSCMYSCGLWLKPREAARVVAHGLSFCTHYLECAELANRQGKCRFKIPPKFHAWVHLIHQVLADLGKVGENGGEQPCCFNICSQSCQMDEDFVGHVATLSRSCRVSVAHTKTMGLYLMNLQW